MMSATTAYEDIVLHASSREGDRRSGLSPGYRNYDFEPKDIQLNVTLKHRYFMLYAKQSYNSWTKSLLSHSLLISCNNLKPEYAKKQK